MVEPDDTCLVVMYKPDGLQRECSSAEVKRINDGWQSILGWLRGSDPDELPHTDLVAEVARKAGLRTIRYPAYDIRAWATQAATLPPTTGHQDRGETGRCPLVAVFNEILTGIGLVRRSYQCCYLTTEAIDLLYGTAPNFHRNRQALTARLLDGPVLIERWDGERRELALAAKFLVRRVLSSAGITNLVHVDTTTRPYVDQVIRALESSAESRTV